MVNLSGADPHLVVHVKIILTQYELGVNCHCGGRQCGNQMLKADSSSTSNIFFACLEAEPGN